MYRQIVIPKNRQLLLQLPAEFVGKQVEVIAFPVNDSKKTEDKYSLENALKFFRKHSIDFSKIKKWKREDLYE